eukprot:2250418-Alexandrium_andersonii.AAC.1
MLRSAQEHTVQQSHIAGVTGAHSTAITQYRKNWDTQYSNHPDTFRDTQEHGVQQPHGDLRAIT